MGLGAPGGTGPGGESGIGSSGGGGGFDGFLGFLGNMFSGEMNAAAMSALAIPFPGNIMALGLLPSAQGDPNATPGVTGPEGSSAGQGGGPPAFQMSTLAQQALTAPPVPAPVKAPAKTIRPAPRRRVGRQETILTSGLADTPSYQPTLLGQ